VPKLEHCSDLTQFRDPRAHELIFRQADLDARLLLMDRMDEEYEKRNMEGTAALFHAEMYLSDRLAYQLWPPPSRFAIPRERAMWPPIGGGGAHAHGD
jgi:hypothetical protein